MASNPSDALDNNASNGTNDNEDIVEKFANLTPNMLFNIGELILAYQEVVKENKVLKQQVEELSQGQPRFDPPFMPIGMRELLGEIILYAKQMNAASTFMVDIIEKKIRDIKMASQPMPPMQQSAQPRGGQRQRNSVPANMFRGAGSAQPELMRPAVSHPSSLAPQYGRPVQSRPMPQMPGNMGGRQPPVVVHQQPYARPTGVFEITDDAVIPDPVPMNRPPPQGNPYMGGNVHHSQWPRR
jgi:hypothetical protein